MRAKIINLKNLSIGLLAVCAIFVFLILQTKAAEQSDAIAVRVMPNPSHDSIGTWYANQGFRGSPQSLIVDGYEAIRDGRTVFINAANLDSDNNKLYTNIYLISYNQESAEKTVDILGQLVSHWKFNNNAATTGFCTISKLTCQADSDCPKNYLCENSSGEPNEGKCIFKEEHACNPLSEAPCNKTKNKTCLIDSDCPVNLFCDSLKAKITRDVKRLGDFNKIKEAIDLYKVNNGNYPDLQSGTYVLGSSISVWPSWKDTLWPKLKLDKLIVDPINTLGYCAGYDPTTCWNKDTNQFFSSELVLPYGSYAFIYKSTKNGVNYDLCGVFEAKDAGYDTAEGQLTSKSCNVGAGYGGSNTNTEPKLISSYTNGETGKEFNGYVKAADLEGDFISWTLTPITPAGSWTGWSGLPVLKDAGDINQKKIYALKAGNQGAYKMLLELKDSRGAATTSELTFNISPANKPKIEAENADYFVDPLNLFKYTFYLQGSDSIPTYTFLPVNPTGDNPLLKANIAAAATTLTPIGLNRVKVDLLIFIPTSTPVISDVTIPYKITATTNGSPATKDINLNFKIEQPYLDFQCENMARLGKAYQISQNNVPRSCLLGNLKSGNHSLRYTVTGPSGLLIRNDDSNAYLESNYISAGTVENNVKIKVVNEYGANTEKTFNLKVNTFCGDGVKQKDNGPNTEGRGGLLNDGMESCDGAQGVQTNAISTSSEIQYGCATEIGTNSPYPIIDNNNCVFKPADAGGGFCGDGVCQFQILANGQPKLMENCWNCSQDCGTCLATIISKADNEHIAYTNSKRLYKQQISDATSTATTTLVAGENVFSFWTHNFYDNQYGLAFLINFGPLPTSTNVNPPIFATFNSSHSALKCTSTPISPSGSNSDDGFDPANILKDGNYNWTDIGFSQNWPIHSNTSHQPPYSAGTFIPFVWDSSGKSAGYSSSCRLSFTYNPYNTGACQPDCAGKTCGSNGCGASCGSCTAGQECSPTGNCVCSPNCNNKCGGSNGCGGSCPNNCQLPETCGGGGVPNVCGISGSCGDSQCGDGETSLSCPIDCPGCCLDLLNSPHNCTTVWCAELGSNSFCTLDCDEGLFYSSDNFTGYGDIGNNCKSKETEVKCGHGAHCGWLNALPQCVTQGMNGGGPGYCGDNICNNGETYMTCCLDCGTPTQRCYLEDPGGGTN